jgi:REP element-mobilizing transposase RayT
MSQDRLTHGDLPHWYRPGFAHFITYRLADTIPATKLREWKSQRAQRLKEASPAGIPPEEHRARAHKQYFAAYDAWLDSHIDRAWLIVPEVAAVIRENLLHHHGTKYELLAWCIMSNHVHVVLQPFEPVDAGAQWNADASRVGHGGRLNSEGFSDEVRDDQSPLSSIMHSLKSYTAKRANEILGRTGRFWQKESYDHWIRDLDELERVVQYVIRNPVSAGLCQKSIDWRFSSAWERYQQDGSDCGMIGTLRDDWRRHV